MSLNASRVSRLYGTQKALDEVSFDIRQGEVVALLGPNGAGKSTMMRIIACFLPQTSGSVRVCGFEVTERPLEVKKRVGYLPENNPLYPDMYVREYLRFVAGIHRLGRAGRDRADEMIELTGLTSEYTKPIGQLSKGYRQRVGLAQALIHDPAVLVLDEPTSGLDPNQLAEIRLLIREIGRQKTVILSTHIMQEVEAVCNRVIIINRGRIMADASTREIRLLDRAGRVVRASFDREADTGLLRNIKGVVEVVKEGPATYRLYAEGMHDIRPGIFHFAVKQGLVLLSVEQKEDTLEQVFRQLTS